MAVGGAGVIDEYALLFSQRRLGFLFHFAHRLNPEVLRMFVSSFLSTRGCLFLNSKSRTLVDDVPFLLSLFAFYFFVQSPWQDVLNAEKRRSSDCVVRSSIAKPMVGGMHRGVTLTPPRRVS